MKRGIRRDDEVVVISGSCKGETGKVLAVDRRRQRVLVEGVNVRRVTIKRSQARPQGGLTDKECPIHISNVRRREAKEAKGRREAAKSTTD